MTNKCTSIAGHFDDRGGGEAIHVAPPDAACPGLHWKPLDAATVRLLALYCSHGRHGNSNQNNNVKCTHFADHFDGGGGAPELYRAHRPMGEVCGFPKSH